MKVVLALVLSLSSISAFATQTIKCQNPSLILKFNEKDVKNLRMTSFKHSELYLNGKVSSIRFAGNYVEFSKTDIATATLLIPRSVIGISTNEFEAFYSDMTPESYSPRHSVLCTSTLSR